jgi:hypothetical protein
MLKERKIPRKVKGNVTKKYTKLESVYFATTGTKREPVDVTATSHVISCSRVRGKSISSCTSAG